MVESMQQMEPVPVPIGEVPEAREGMPVAFFASLAIAAAYAVGFAGVQIAQPLRQGAGLMLAGTGVRAAMYVMCAIGAMELARRLDRGGDPIAAMGARIAARAWLVHLVLAHGWSWFIPSLHGSEHFRLYAELQYDTLAACALASTVGLTMAAWRANRSAAIVGLVVGVLTYLPYSLSSVILKPLDLGYAASQILELVFEVGYFLAIYVLAQAASRTAPASRPDPSRAARGLRAMAAALNLRVIVAVSVSLLTIFVALTNGGAGTVDILKFATFVALGVNILAFGWFGVGALNATRAAVRDLPRPLLALGGWAALFCGGATLAQAYPLYEILYGRERGYGSGYTAELAQALPIALPLVAIVGPLLVAIAIGVFARARRLPALASATSSRAIGFVALTIATFALQQGALPSMRSAGAAAMTLLLAVGCGLAAMILLGGLLKRAADDVEGREQLEVF